MRKVYVTVKTRLIIRVDDDADVEEVLDQLDYSYSDATGKASVEDTLILDYEVTDSK